MTVPPVVFGERIVEPRRLWIRRAPRRWPWPEEPSFDLAAGRLLWPGASERGEVALSLRGRMQEFEPGEAIYLPPVRPELRREKRLLAGELAAHGCVVVDHGAMDEEPQVGDGIWTVRDLFAALLSRDLDRLATTPPNAVVVVPLLPSLSDSPALVRPWFERLAAARPAAVLGIAADLSPLDRRALAERIGESAFDAVHHAPPIDERAFARAARDAGLESSWARPVVAGARFAPNRSLAGVFQEIADLSHRLGGSESRCEALRAVARKLDGAPWEIAALAREGNLAVFPWPDEEARATAEEWLAAGRSERLEALRADYLDGARV